MPKVLLLADDLIWMSRLAAATERAGASVVRATSAEAARTGLEAGVDGVVIDLGGRSYDGVAQVQLAASTGRPTVAVGQHEDRELRLRARAAGARQVYSYNRFFTAGPELVAGLLRAGVPTRR